MPTGLIIALTTFACAYHMDSFDFKRLQKTLQYSTELIQSRLYRIPVPTKINMPSWDIFEYITGFRYSFVLEHSNVILSPSQLCDYLHTHYHENISESELARLMSTEPSNVRRWLNGEAWDVDRIIKMYKLTGVGNLKLICIKNVHQHYDSDPVDFVSEYVRKHFYMRQLNNLNYILGFGALLSKDLDKALKYNRTLDVSKIVRVLYDSLPPKSDVKIKTIARFASQNPSNPIPTARVKSWLSGDTKSINIQMYQRLQNEYMKRVKPTTVSQIFAPPIYASDRQLIVNIIGGPRVKKSAYSQQQLDKKEPVDGRKEMYPEPKQVPITITKDYVEDRRKAQLIEGKYVLMNFSIETIFE